MRIAIATGILGIALCAGAAAAQTAGEQSRILRDFEQRVDDYARHHCLSLFPEAVTAAAPASKIFTPPVAVVFRQLIARALTPSSGAAMGGLTTTHRAAVLAPFPAGELTEFPEVLRQALPLLPAPLEYRLIDNDLVIRDAKDDLIIAVLRDAVGFTPAR